MEDKRKALIITIFSLLGNINSFFLGFYLSTTVFEIIGYSKEELKTFYLSHLTLIIFLTAVIVFLTSFGTYSFWKESFKKGGMLNLLGGIILLMVYLYYCFIFQPSLLAWLKPLGYILPLFSILSGCLGIIAK